MTLGYSPRIRPWRYADEVGYDEGVIYCNWQVQYYGLIKQQTGEDWNDAKVSLSTAQPSVGGAAPVLPTRLIHFKRPKPKPVQRAGMAKHLQWVCPLNVFTYFLACYSLNYDEYDPTIVSL